MRQGRGRIQILAELTKLRLLACHPRLYDPRSKLASSKLEAVHELLEEIRGSEHRALVFSQFTKHLHLLRQRLDKVGRLYLYLDGSTPERERRKRVQAFQAGEGDVFLISLKAGGTGLNLTGADFVIHLDPWWNPAVEDQATDRAHSIGQTRPVNIYRFVSRGTIEEQIMALHERKRELAQDILTGTDGAGRMDSSDLMRLIAAIDAPAV